MTSIDEIDDALLHQYADKFFRLIDGQFRMKQLPEYVGQMLRVKLLSRHVDVLSAYAVERGAKACGDLTAPDLYTFPVKRRKPFPKGKHDKATLDLFGGKR